MREKIRDAQSIECTNLHVKSVGEMVYVDFFLKPVFSSLYCKNCGKWRSVIFVIFNIVKSNLFGQL